MWHWLNLKRKYSDVDRKLITAVNAIAGFSPGNLELYRIATVHSSHVQHLQDKKVLVSNERLEYLGDAVLGATVADYLFKKYPFEKEGFLTEIRARIVNREALNQLARKIGIASILNFDKRNGHLRQVILGNALEAIVGAVYLDKGYKRTKYFVIEKLIMPHFDLDVIVQADPNYKSQVIEWAQCHGYKVRFELISDEIKENNIHEFTVQVYIDDKPKGLGIGSSKKKAEQKAAENTCEELNLNG